MDNIKNLLAIDIGTNSVTAAVGQIDIDNDRIELFGISSVPPDGFRKGLVVEMKKTVETVRKAAETAQQISGISCEEAVVGIAGSHIKSINVCETYTLKSPEKEINYADIEAAIQQARCEIVTLNRDILHTIPQLYKLDDNPATPEPPLGMFGNKLMVNVHFITAAVVSAHNLARTVQLANYHVSDTILNPIASSYAVLTPEEKYNGILLLDIGETTTDLAIHINNSIWHTAVINLGGYDITRDIACAFKIPMEEAKRIKEDFGDLYSNMSNDFEIQAKGLGTTVSVKIRKSELDSVIRSRVRSIVDVVISDIDKLNFRENSLVGVVVTGGTAKLKGIDKFIETVLGAPVRIGMAQGISGQETLVKNTENSAVLGLLIYAKETLKNTKNNPVYNIEESWQIGINNMLIKFKDFCSKMFNLKDKIGGKL